MHLQAFHAIDTEKLDWGKPLGGQVGGVSIRSRVVLILYSLPHPHNSIVGSALTGVALYVVMYLATHSSWL